jgi:hypothetical protein
VGPINLITGVWHPPMPCPFCPFCPTSESIPTTGVGAFSHRLQTNGGRPPRPQQRKPGT